MKRLLRAAAVVLASGACDGCGPEPIIVATATAGVDGGRAALDGGHAGSDASGARDGGKRADAMVRPADSGAHAFDATTDAGDAADASGSSVEGGVVDGGGADAGGDAGSPPLEGGPPMDGAPPPMDGGPKPFDGGPGQGCTSNAGCLPNEFCAKATCSSASGRCERLPMFCDNDFHLVCGCDGVVYWNDCLRQQEGVAAGVPSVTGECSGSFASCGGTSGTSCPPNAWCNRLIPGPFNGCNLSPVGSCWVLPPVCPTDAGGVPQLASCGTGPHKCTDVCSAIESGQPHQQGMCH
jgi:hypothetical protein